MSLRRRVMVLVAQLVSPQLWRPLGEYAKEQLRRGDSELHRQALLALEELEQRDLVTDLSNVRTAYTIVSVAWFLFGSSGVLCCLAAALVLVVDVQMGLDDAEAPRALTSSASSQRSPGHRRRSVVGVTLDAVSIALEPLEQAGAQLEASASGVSATSPATVKRSKGMWPFALLSPKSQKRQERAAPKASVGPPQLSPLQKGLKSVGSLGEMLRRGGKKRTAAT
jgi:hypothetical protein